MADSRNDVVVACAECSGEGQIPIGDDWDLCDICHGDGDIRFPVDQGAEPTAPMTAPAVALAS